MGKFMVFSAVLLAAVVAVAAPIQVRKGVRANPTLFFDASGCDETMAREIGNMLYASNHFDLLKSGTSDYVLKVKSSSGREADYVLSVSGNTVSRGAVSGSDGRDTAKTLVDKILKDCFGVKVFCRTRIAFCAETGKGLKNIFLCDVDGRNVEQLTRYNSLCVEPNFFPDGRSVCYTKYNDSGTDVAETTVSPVRTRRLTSFPGLNAGVAVDPSRRYMALILSRDQQVELYVKEINSRALKRMTSDNAVEASPCWSPDGRFICYVSDKSGKPQLYVTDLNGSTRRLETAGSEAYTPDWSPDGKIAYVTRLDGLYVLAIHDVKTGKNAVVPNLSGSWESPSWAPDNRHLVCSRRSGRAGRSTLHVVDTETGRERQLVNTEAGVSMPSWSRAETP